MPLRSSLGTLDAGLIGGGCGISRVLGGRDSKKNSYHFSGSKGFVGRTDDVGVHTGAGDVLPHLCRDQDVNRGKGQPSHPLAGVLEKGARADLKVRRGEGLYAVAREGLADSTIRRWSIMVYVCLETSPKLSLGESESSGVLSAVVRNGCSVRCQIAQLTPRYYDG